MNQKPDIPNVIEANISGRWTKPDIFNGPQYLVEKSIVFYIYSDIFKK